MTGMWQIRREECMLSASSLDPLSLMFMSSLVTVIFWRLRPMYEDDPSPSYTGSTDIFGASFDPPCHADAVVELLTLFVACHMTKS